MRKFVLTLTAILALGLSASAQNQRITGTVATSEGEPLAGVTVVVAGTQTGTVTDRDGSYAINVPKEAVLVFRLLGMKSQEISTSGRTRIDVSMIAETENIEDVIVVAYGTAKREAFTGSAGVIKSTELAKRQVSNVTNALVGQVAGVQAVVNNGQPGVGSNINIRGIGSISSSNSPLYVVDGVPYDGDIAAINPQDIESMSVLKDAAASAIYGARGANGVVIVTTKRGTSTDAIITFDAKWGSNSKEIPRYDVISDPAQYYETFYLSHYNGLLGQMSPSAANAAVNNMLFDAQAGGLGYRVFTTPEGQRFIGLNGKLNPNATLGYSDGEYYYTPDDWYGELFNKGNLRQEYNLSIAGATDRASYYISGGYLDDSGIIPGSGFTRYTARFKGDFQAKKWLKVGANMNYTYYDQQYPGEQTSHYATSSINAFYLANMMGPIYPLYVRDPKGNIMIDDAGYTVYDYGDATASNAYRPFMAISNPASKLQLDKEFYRANVFGGKWFANVDIVKGLRLSANLGVDASHQLYSQLNNKYYGQTAGQGGSIYKQEARIVSTNQQYLLTYANTWGRHNLDLLGGFEHYNYTYSHLDGTRDKIYSSDVDEINNAILNDHAYSETDKYSTMGYLFRAQYNFGEKYFLSASYRRDASSRFHPDNRWGDFGSVGVAWLLNKERWLSDVDWLSLLKLKASYGVQGNDNILYNEWPYDPNYYPYMDQYKISESNGEFATTLYYKGNKDITWETSYNFNVGVEFGFLHDRLFGSVEYFNRITRDLIYNVPTANSAGYTYIPQNIGKIRNAGVEVDLTGVLVTNKNILWTVNANLTHFKNKILDLFDGAPEYGVADDGYLFSVGGTLYDMLLPSWAGVDPETGKALYYQSDGKYGYEYDDNGELITVDKASKAGQINQGCMLPKIYGGFGTSLSVYGLDFSISFSYQLGGKVYDNTYHDLMHVGSGVDAGVGWHKDILKAWTPQNPSSDIPALNYLYTDQNSASSRFLISSDYLSINNITLGYTLPQKWMKGWFVDKVRVYFSADNVAVFARRKGLDPRQSLGGGGVGAYAYSAIRTLSGGITITF